MSAIDPFRGVAPDEPPGTELKLNPCDGYQARIEEWPDQLQVRLILRVNGQVVSYAFARNWGDKSPQSRGECQRSYWLWAAIAHYLNAGGDPDEVILALNRLQPTPLYQPEGHFLLDTRPNENAPELFEHVFSDGQGKLRIWSEQLGYREVSEVEFLRESEDEDG